MVTLLRRRSLRRATKQWEMSVLGLVVLCGAAVAANCEQATPHRVAIERPVKPAPVGPADGSHLSCSGGSEDPAELTLVPDAVLTDAGRETVEYHGEIAVNRGHSVGVAWEADVVDDRADKVYDKLAVGSAKGAKGESKTTGAILAKLADGFYILRVRAAISPDDEPSTVLEATQHINVENGKWREMTDVEWRKRSNASLAFLAPKGGLQ